jgi:hypothetical protein
MLLRRKYRSPISRPRVVWGTCLADTWVLYVSSPSSGALIEPPGAWLGSCASQVVEHLVDLGDLVVDV